jgi:hypothetical protein
VIEKVQRCKTIHHNDDRWQVTALQCLPLCQAGRVGKIGLILSTCANEKAALPSKTSESYVATLEVVQGLNDPRHYLRVEAQMQIGSTNR